MSALEDAPLKIFVGLSSIIGVTGMAGNAWYGFSNEVLEILLGKLSAHRPDIATLSVAYSIWRDVGMGWKMGSVERLEKAGVGAIPTQEGVERFVRVFLNDPGTDRIVVAARIAPSGTVQDRIETGSRKRSFSPKKHHFDSGCGIDLRSASLFGKRPLPGGPRLQRLVSVSHRFRPGGHGSGGGPRGGKNAIRTVEDSEHPPETTDHGDPEHGADIVIQAVTREKTEENAPQSRSGQAFSSRAQGRTTPFFPPNSCSISPSPRKSRKSRWPAPPWTSFPNSICTARIFSSRDRSSIE